MCEELIVVPALNQKELELRPIISIPSQRKATKPK